MAQLLDGAPCTEASIAGFALRTFGVVPSVLVKRNSAGKVGGAHYVATAAAVVLSEVPGEWSFAERT